jgi:hypothetical protein
MWYSGAWGRLIHEKTWSRKSDGTVHLRKEGVKPLGPSVGAGGTNIIIYSEELTFEDFMHAWIRNESGIRINMKEHSKRTGTNSFLYVSFMWRPLNERHSTLLTNSMQPSIVQYTEPEFATFKGTVSWDRFQIFWPKFKELGLTKGRDWCLNFSEAPMIL